MMNIQYKKYLAHNFLRTFTHELFFSFGAILIFIKTESVFWVLLFSFITSIVAILAKSVGVNYYLRTVERFGAYTVITLGLFLNSLAFLMLFYLNNQTPHFLVLLVVTAILHEGGNVLYWPLSNALKFTLAGSSDLPGKYTSYIRISTKIAGISAVLTGLILNIKDDVVYLFLVGFVMLFLSIFPLRGVTMPKLQITSFRMCMKTLSLSAILSNINVTHLFRKIALPLIIVFLFGSIDSSIWITGLTAMGTIIVTYAAGWLKDLHSNTLNIFVAILIPLVFVVYGFITTPLQFIMLGILVGLLYEIAATGRESRLSREVVNTGNSLNATIAVEFSRSLGAVIGILILMLLYISTNTLPQWILATGALFVLPFVYYSIGNIALKKHSQIMR